MVSFTRQMALRRSVMTVCAIFVSAPVMAHAQGEGRLQARARVIRAPGSTITPTGDVLTIDAITEAVVFGALGNSGHVLATGGPSPQRVCGRRFACHVMRAAASLSRDGAVVEIEGGPVIWLERVPSMGDDIITLQLTVAHVAN